MPGTNATSRPAGPGPASRAYQIMTAVSMTIGRGPLARAAADAARLTPADRVIDIGCGPGTAVRQAARHADAATGIDPSPVMLRLARQISRIRRSRNVSWAEGKAENLPAPDGQATAAWAISSVHHWDDRAAGLSEASRALAPGGRLVLVERLARPGARGHAAHGLTRHQADDLARQLTAAGFLRVEVRIRKAGHRNLVIICGQTSIASRPDTRARAGAGAAAARGIARGNPAVPRPGRVRLRRPCRPVPPHHGPRVKAGEAAAQYL